MSKLTETFSKEERDEAIRRFHALAAQCRHIEIGRRRRDVTTLDGIHPDKTMVTLELTMADCLAVVCADLYLLSFEQAAMRGGRSVSPAKLKALEANRQKSVASGKSGRRSLYNTENRENLQRRSTFRVVDTAFNLAVGKVCKTLSEAIGEATELVKAGHVSQETVRIYSGHPDMSIYDLQGKCLGDKPPQGKMRTKR